MQLRAEDDVADDISIERLVVAETGSGLGMAMAKDEAQSSGSRWMLTRWCHCVDVAGLLLGAEEGLAVARPLVAWW